MCFRKNKQFDKGGEQISLGICGLTVQSLLWDGRTTVRRYSQGQPTESTTLQQFERNLIELNLRVGQIYKSEYIFN